MELAILRAVQSVANPVLDVLFTVISVLSESVVTALLISFVYWVWNKEEGEYLAFALLGGLCVNGLLKNLIQAPRPIGQEGVRTLYAETATGSSFPSGHTQNVATLCGAFAWRRRTMWQAALCLVPPVLVALSRLYLGVHWPRDVLAAYVLGLIVSAGVYMLFYTFNESGRELAAVLLALLLLVPVLLWGDSDFAKCYGMLVGYAIGVPLEHRFVHFSVEGPCGKRLVRWLVGLAVLGAIRLAIKLLLPQTLLVDGLAYGAVAFALCFVCPALFKALRL